MGTHVRRSTGNQEAAPWPQETGSLPGLVMPAWASGGSRPLAVCLWPPLSEDPQNKGAGCGIVFVKVRFSQPAVTVCLVCLLPS